MVSIPACMRKLVLIQFPIYAWKVVEGWRREVTARRPDYGYEKHITGLERHVNRIVNTRFLPFKPSHCQVSAPRQRAL
ncbi:hypothetical protein DPMN_128570 [Dreissena polymorpha]|uniref:Uncharacterized protein n=1 Tax=Dreissena polymorpha TaxID=45954 RepID=A0A9D4H472_DREPO|nr:hypothetical protein DPMN_128570 [Dreissena polymorpha]